MGIKMKENNEEVNRLLRRLRRKMGDLTPGHGGDWGADRLLRAGELQPRCLSPLDNSILKKATPRAWNQRLSHHRSDRLTEAIYNQKNTSGMCILKRT